jgi:membrane-associated protease RseP (regulator of RpoE activity)
MPYSKHAYQSKERSEKTVSSRPEPRISNKDWVALLVGIALVAFFWSGINSLQTIHFVSIVLGFLLITTFLVRKFVPNSKTWFVFGMIETKRFNAFFDKLKNAKWLEIATEIGAVIGYGAIAIDYFWGRKLKKIWQRALLFIVSVAVLGFLSGLMFGNLAENPLVKGPGWLYQFFFGFFGLAGFLLLALFTQGIDGVFKIFAGKQACPGIAPVIPGVQTPNVPIYIPIQAWISLVAILIIHEAAHGFLVRRHNVKLESSGLLLAGILPIGAFVKPDEKQMAKIEKRKQVQIMSAGPSANLYSFFIIGILLAGATVFVFNPTIGQLSNEVQRNSSLGVKISAVDENTVLCGETFSNPAYGELPAGSRIVSINDENVNSVNDTLLLLQKNAGEPKKFTVDSNGQIITKTLTPNALGKFGIQVEGIPNPDYVVPANTQLLLDSFQLILSIIVWFVNLSLLVAVANFLPVDPLDGGRIAKFMITPYFGFLKMSEQDTERFVGRLFMWILIPLIILNAIPLFV